MNEPSSLDADCRALVALKAWTKVGGHTWALVPQTSDEPILAAVSDRPDGSVAGRLLLFPGFAALRDYLLLRQAPERGYALSPLDVRHWEVIGSVDGSFALQSFHPGYVPQPVSPEGRVFLAPLIRECLGVLMRVEEDPDLPARYAPDHKLFARVERLDGKWQDAPLAPPAEIAGTRPERIGLDRAACTAAARLPFVESLSWEADFFAVPSCHTDEPHPRILYLFAAVDAQTGLRTMWERISVPTRGGADLQSIWEGLAQRLLAAMLKRGAIPGRINVRSGRMARFLRPLGLHIPFRLVQHGQLPALDRAMNQALKDKSF